MHNISQRLENLHKTQHLNWDELSEKLQLSLSMVMQIRSGKRNMSQKAIFRLERLERELGVHNTAQIVHPKPRFNAGPHYGMSDGWVPIISWASAGDAHAYEDQGADVPHIHTDCKDANCYALYVEGDSMTPYFSSGDILVAAPNSEARPGDLVVAKTNDDESYFKKLEIPASNREIIRLVSFNDWYSPIELHLSNVRFIHPVYSVLRIFKLRPKKSV